MAKKHYENRNKKSQFKIYYIQTCYKNCEKENPLYAVFKCVRF